MPRPKPRSGSSTWRSQPFPLNERQRQELAGFLGSPDNVDSALAEVAKWLGFYGGAVAATRTAPNATVKRGRPTTDPPTKVIDELRRIFQRYYVGGDTNRVAKGRVSDLSEREDDEAEFIALALDVAGIPHLEDVHRHFTAPGAALVNAGDRATQLKKLSIKVWKARKGGRG